jgi:hypothetical protein
LTGLTEAEAMTAFIEGEGFLQIGEALNGTV